MDSTRRFFSTDFIIKNKLSFSNVVLLQDIYFWILSRNPPKSFQFQNETYYFISQSHFCELNKGLLNQQRVSAIFKELKKIGIIHNSILVDLHKNYISLNWQKIKESILIREELEQIERDDWWKRIHDYADEQIALKKQPASKMDSNYEVVEKNNRLYLVKKKQQQADSYNRTNEENMAGLLDDKDMQLQKPKYCKQADAIAKRILTKYVNYFQNRIPQAGQQPTKTYISICHKIEDIYNGNFTKSRFYEFDNSVFNNKQFDTEGWREKINNVKGDWSKVKALIFNAVENFVLMYEEDRMPFKKDWLTNNLSEWFHSENPNSRNQSQFIQSLNEPQIQKSKLGMDKAKNIVEDLKKKSPVSYYAGHELNELLPANANELTAWQFITDIIKWGKLLWQFDENAKYFMQCKINGELQAGPKVLPALFARWLKDEDVSVTLATLDIKQSSANNGPWRWFYEQACRKHDMNPNFVDCFDTADFYDARKMSGKITFDDMNEIPVF